MDALARIERAIRAGEAHGLASLGPVDTVIYAIAEAEVYCDKDGVDSLVDHYGVTRMSIFAQAYSAIGASEIAQALRAIAMAPQPVPEALLARAHELIACRKGYSSESIEEFVRRCS